MHALNTKLIALDADGVLLDYHSAYAKAWGRAFGEDPELIDPLAYWPMDRYKVRRLGGAELALFRAQMDEEFWSTIPAMQGALEAAQALRRAGYDLVCVSALAERNSAARLANLRSIGFPIDSVVSAHGEASIRSPKADALASLMPAAFVDDYLPYFRGVPDGIHTALIARSPNGTPNKGPEMALTRSAHSDLLDFSRFWLGSPKP